MIGLLRRTAVSLFWMFLFAGLMQGAVADLGAAAPEKSSYFQVRGGLENARVRFIQEKQGRVAFLGGSITTMPGWRDLTCEMLKKRFPETAFDFINAGIGGTNSTLGAFRFEQDVFANGPVDLLFLEYAVNDGGGDSPDDRSARAMEGIIRHARRLNPKMDILVQYFADTGKVEEYRKGKTPDVIAKHDRVVEYYALPIINMAQEMTRRMDAGAFTWEQFSGDTCHPSPFGHAQYAECIAAFLDVVWATPPDAAAPRKDYAVPAPLDKANYENGRFLGLDSAKIVAGWNRNTQWDTEKKCNYGGVVDVLSAETPGASLELSFEGTVIGISAIAGMDAGILECSVDGSPFRKIDLFDNYCLSFHRPICRVLAEDLLAGKHVLTLRMSEERNPQSVGNAARIVKFVAN